MLKIKERDHEGKDSNKKVGYLREHYQKKFKWEKSKPNDFLESR